jgi:septation ring formation regulator EzrA
MSSHTTHSSADAEIKRLDSRMTGIEESLLIIKEDLQTVIQTLGRASSRCSLLNLPHADPQIDK